MVIKGDCQSGCITGQPSSRRPAGDNVPAGTLALVRSFLVLRCSSEQNALRTLIHQRHLTPSCGGHAPTAERTLHPARMLTESLTPRPELENGELDPTAGIREQHKNCQKPSRLNLVALFRLEHPAVERIAHVKIQARFIEWLIGIVAVIAHYFRGNLILALWLVWSVGSFAGGLAGGVLLEKLGATSGKMQKSVLRLAYLVAIAGALLPFLNWGRGKG
jgi:hypothetical protein